MAFLTTHPAELTAAASTLAAISSAMAAQNMAAAAPTTGVAPAAADTVSALQATQFSAYGTLYQQIGAQAAAIHQQIVSTLATSAGSYGTTETFNAFTTGTSASGLSPLDLLTGKGTYGVLGTMLSNGGLSGVTQTSNFGSGLSCLASCWSAPAAAENVAAQELVNDDSPAPVTTVSTTGAAGSMTSAGAPGVGQSSSVGRLSVPPSWGVQLAAQPNPAGALAGTSTAAAQGTPLAGVPASMPAGAGGQDNSGAKPAKYAAKVQLTPPTSGV